MKQTAWNSLSIRDKAAYIRQSVSDGIYNLGEIRNRFDEGGDIDWQNRLKQIFDTNSQIFQENKDANDERAIRENKIKAEAIARGSGGADNLFGAGISLAFSPGKLFNPHKNYNTGYQGIIEQSNGKRGYVFKYTNEHPDIIDAMYNDDVIPFEKYGVKDVSNSPDTMLLKSFVIRNPNFRIFRINDDTVDADIINEINNKIANNEYNQYGIRRYGASESGFMPIGNSGFEYDYKNGSRFVVDTDSGRYYKNVDVWDYDPVKHSKIARKTLTRIENAGNPYGVVTGWHRVPTVSNPYTLNDFYIKYGEPSKYDDEFVNDFLSKPAYEFSEGGDKNTINHPKYNAKQVNSMYDYLRENGLTNEQASGLLGNLAVESYLNADMNQVGGTAYGLMQAEGDRQRKMKNYNKVPYSFGSGLTDEEQWQLDYIINDGVKRYTSGEWGKKGYKGARDARKAFLNADTTRNASDIITNNYLRPGKPALVRRRAMSDYYDAKQHERLPYQIEYWSKPLESWKK